MPSANNASAAAACIPPLPTRAEVCQLTATWRQNGERVAFTSGVFDLLHSGHLHFLSSIKAQTGAARLVVGVNDDASVRALKGDFRPLVPATERAELVAALVCVDAAFIFSETTNAANVQALQPAFYVKAADYTAAQLQSAKYLAAWGGQTLTLPIHSGYSTTARIDGIILKALQSGIMPVQLPAVASSQTGAGEQQLKQAVFLDRDGVIVMDTEYLHRPEDVRLVPRAITGLKLLMTAGYALVVVTNQPGIGMGYFSTEAFFRVNKAMLKLLSKEGILLTGIYFCPHTQAQGCSCRKPAGALVQRAQRDHRLALNRSFFIGDQTSDIEAARRLDISAILVQTGKGGKDGKYAVTPAFVAADCLAAAEWIIKTAAQPAAKH